MPANAFEAPVRGGGTQWFAFPVVLATQTSDPSGATSITSADASTLVTDDSLATVLAAADAVFGGAWRIGPYTLVDGRTCYFAGAVASRIQPDPGAPTTRCYVYVDREDVLDPWHVVADAATLAAAMWPHA